MEQVLKDTNHKAVFCQFTFALFRGSYSQVLLSRILEKKSLQSLPPEENEYYIDWY